MWKIFLRKPSIGLMLVGIGVIILPTATPEDLVTTVPLLAVSPSFYLGTLVPIGLASLLLGLLLLRMGK